MTHLIMTIFQQSINQFSWNFGKRMICSL